MTDNIPLLMVFLAGLLSFLSPCVLSLIPSYFSILGGVGFEKKEGRSRLVMAAASFILGFSMVFIAFGLLMNTVFFFASGFLGYINWVAGIIVIILGLNIIFDFFSFLNYEKRPFFQQRMRSGGGAAFIAGAAFGTGWTPCVGPILTAILLMAARSGQAGIAAFYLGVYSLGLGLPFILTALFFDFFLKHASRFRSHLPLIRRISGILLVIMGVMILSGRYSALNVLIQRMVFSYIDWAETQALPFRLLANALAWIQSF